MKEISFTFKEELVLKVLLERAWNPNMISFDDLKGAHSLKGISVDSLKGVFGSLCKKGIIMFDDEVEGNEIFTFQFPVATDQKPKEVFDGYVDTIDKVKQWFAEGKDSLRFSPEKWK